MVINFEVMINVIFSKGYRCLFDNWNRSGYDESKNF